MEKLQIPNSRATVLNAFGAWMLVLGIFSWLHGFLRFGRVRWIQRFGKSESKIEREQGMKNKIKTTIALLALGVTAIAVNAQEVGGPPGDGGPGNAGPGGMRGHRPPPPIFAALDANHDGVIDADEIANASAALKTLDKNGDGKLTSDELRPPRPEGQKEGANSNRPHMNGHRPPPSPLVGALDANHDGVIDADEIANASAALKTLDKNGDGQLTRDELRPQGRPPGMNRQGPPPGDDSQALPPEQN